MQYLPIAGVLRDFSFFTLAWLIAHLLCFSILHCDASGIGSYLRDLDLAFANALQC